MLASEYGWAKDDILNNVYLDELFVFAERINLRKIRELQMQLAIVQNPHTKKPDKLWNILKQNEPKQKRSEEFDEIGFEILKSKLRKNPKFIVK